MEITKQILGLPDGALYTYEQSDGRIYQYGGCDHDEIGITVADLKALARDYEQVKAALSALVAAAEASGEIWTGGDALPAAKSLLPAGGEDEAKVV